MDRKVIFALILGALFIVSIGSVAADGIYWGDSAALSVGDEPFIGIDYDINPDVAIGSYKDKKIKDPEPILLKGIYWGD